MRQRLMVLVSALAIALIGAVAVINWSSSGSRAHSPDDGSLTGPDVTLPSSPPPSPGPPSSSATGSGLSSGDLSGGGFSTGGLTGGTLSGGGSGSLNRRNLSRLGSSLLGCSTSGPTKPALRGLVSIDQLSSKAATEVHNMSVNIPWSELQPNSSTQFNRPAEIDAAVARVKKLGTCAGVEVRVLAGVESPNWAKTLSGPPVPYYVQEDNRRGTIPRFWEKPFQDAYAAMQARLAAMYDNTPQIRLVAMSMCTTFYAEPMIRQGDDGNNATNLIASGYTISKDEQCQARQISTQQVWTRTRSLLALNPYERVDLQHRSQPDVNEALAFGRQCRQVLGKRCVLGNNSVRWPPLTGNYRTLYDGLHAMGPPLAFQLAVPTRVGDVVRAAQWAADIGAVSLEITETQAEQYAQRLHTTNNKLSQNSS